MKDLRCLLNFDPVTIRSEIAKHVRHIVLTPEGRTYRATGTWDLLGCGSMDGAGGPVCTIRPCLPMVVLIAA